MSSEINSLYNVMKTKLIKLRHFVRVCIHDLFTPYGTILATILFVILSTVSNYVRPYKEIDESILIGIVSSSLVAIVIEIQSNLKFNIRRHNELIEYFLELTLLKFELAYYKKKEYDTDPVKIIWANLPKLIRVFKDVNQSKLEWLTCTEARAIQNILIINQTICLDLGTYLEDEIGFYETDFLQSPNTAFQTISDMPKEMAKELIRNKKKEDIDKLVQNIFYEGRHANYDLTKNVCIVDDYYVGKPSIESIEKNVLSKYCSEILSEIEILFPYIKYEYVYLVMKLAKEKKAE